MSFCSANTYDMRSQVVLCHLQVSIRARIFVNLLQAPRPALIIFPLRARSIEYGCIQQTDWP